MAKYSEATQRIFERALAILQGKLEAEELKSLLGLVATGAFSDLQRLDQILKPTETTDAD